MNTEEKVIEAIKENIEWQDKISLEDKLIQDLGIDSFDMLMIINALEDDFSIQIENEDLVDLEIVADVVEKLNEKLLVKQ